MESLHQVVPATKDRPSFFQSSDDNALTQQILGTHAPDMLNIRVKPVLSMVDDIMRLAKPLTADTTSGAEIPSHADTSDVKVFHTSSRDGNNPNSDPDAKIVEMLANPINNISYLMTYKYGGSVPSGGGELHEVTMDLLKSLSSYSWDAKVVIALAAFAINYGEFWLVDHLRTNNQLADNIATLMDLPDTMALDDQLRKLLEGVFNLLTQVLKVTHCIIEFMELPAKYISPGSPEITAAKSHFPTAAYLIIRSLVVSASTLLNIICSHDNINSTYAAREISSLPDMLSVTLEHLRNQMKICKDVIEGKKAYTSFGSTIQLANTDNLRVFRIMIRSRDDQRPLYDGSKRTKEGLEVLKSKYILLLISDLDLPPEELNILMLVYSFRSRNQEYEVLWLPILDQTTTLTLSQETLFYGLRNSMPWYSVDHPSLVDPVAIRFIRQEWKFEHMPMAVVLDHQGKPSNLDALPMMWIWGSMAFPFTIAREGHLWAESSWNIDLLADAIDPRIPEWISDNKVICLYGGDDIEWIRKFTLSARAAAETLHAPPEMLYVGKRNPKEKVRLCHEVIIREKLSHIFSVDDYFDYVFFFWMRLWSMLESKKKCGARVENDYIMQEIMDLLAFDSSEQGWAVFSLANKEITKGNGGRLLPILENCNQWGNKVDHPNKFVVVLDEQLKGFEPEHHGNRLNLPGIAG